MNCIHMKQLIHFLTIQTSRGMSYQMMCCEGNKRYVLEENESSSTQQHFYGGIASTWHLRDYLDLVFDARYNAMFLIKPYTFYGDNILITCCN